MPMYPISPFMKINPSDVTRLGAAFVAVALVLAAGISASVAEPLRVRIGFASVGSDNRQFAGGSSAAVAHSEHYVDDELRDLPDVKVEWSFFKGAGPAVNEAFANNQLDFAIQGDLPEIILADLPGSSQGLSREAGRGSPGKKGIDLPRHQ